MPMHVWPSARQPSAIGFDALGAVAPGRVHLKVAAEVALRHDGRVARQRQRLLHRQLTEEVARAAAAATRPCRACRDAATAASTVDEAPVSTSSVMMRALDGPMYGTSRSVPAATRSPTVNGSAMTAFAARL